MSKMKTGLTIAAVAAAGYGAWSLYKRANPNATAGIKNAASKIMKSTEKNIENMM